MKTIFAISILMFFIGCSEATNSIMPNDDPLSKARKDLKKQKAKEMTEIGVLKKDVEDVGKMISDMEKKYN